MGRRNHIRAGFMHCGMQYESGPVHRLFPVHHVTVVIDQDQVTGPDVAKTHRKGIDPEMISELRVAHRDVTGYPFTKSQTAKDPQRPGQFGFAMGALFFHRGKSFGQFETDILRG